METRSSEIPHGLRKPGGGLFPISLRPASPWLLPFQGLPDHPQGMGPSSAPGRGLEGGDWRRGGGGGLQGAAGSGKEGHFPRVGGYREEGWRRVWSKGRVRLGAGKARRGRAEDEWEWELPRSGGEEEPHEPTSHVSREPSLPSRQLPAGRRPSAAGGQGGAGRGTLRTPGSTAPRGRSAPPSGGGRDSSKWRWGAPGARPSHGLRRGPSRGRSCSGGLSPSAPPGQRGLLGRRVLSFCPGSTQSRV